MSSAHNSSSKISACERKVYKSHLSKLQTARPA